MIRTATVIGGALLAIGVIGMGIGVANGQGVNTQSVSFDQTKSFSAADLKNVDLDVDYGFVHITESPTNNVNVHVYGDVNGTKNHQNLDFRTNVSGGRLLVTIRHPWNQHSVFNLPWPFVTTSNQGLTIDVQVPKGTLDTLSSEVNAGKLEAENVEVKQITLHTDAGQLTVSNSKGTLEAHSNAGAVLVTNVVGAMDLKTDAGKIEVDEQEILYDIKAETSAGGVNVTTQKEPQNVQFKLHTDVGHASLDLPQAKMSQDSNSDIEGSIGSGGPLVDLQSSVGAVSLGLS